MDADENNETSPERQTENTCKSVDPVDLVLNMEATDTRTIYFM